MITELSDESVWAILRLLFEFPKSYTTVCQELVIHAAMHVWQRLYVSRWNVISSTGLVSLASLLNSIEYIVRDTLYSVRERERFDSFGGHRLEGTGQLHRRIVGTCPV